MSPVRDLRAMFENKDDTSLPDRGRSPGVSSSHQSVGNASVSPRPLSKVRTNFVAIEKDGRIGLQRDHSGESSLSRRRLSSEASQEKPKMASSDLVKAARNPVFDEPIPESPRLKQGQSSENTQAGALPDKPSANPDKQTDGEQPATAMSSGDTTARTPAKSTAANGASQKAKSKESTVTKTRPSALSGKTAAKAVPKPSTTTRGRTAVTKEASNTSTSTRASATSAIPRSTASTIGKKPQPLKPTGPRDTGFVKPKPKSPTKPVHLPSSLTAPTASSVSKTGAAPRQSLSRQSGVAATKAPSVATAGKSIHRQGSSASRPRPSIGPPPVKPASHDATTASKRPSHVDEGFLARMMRPTQASSSKTSEKAPPTPPRKTAHRPLTADIDDSPRRESNGKRIPSGQGATSTHKPTTPAPKPSTRYIDNASKAGSVSSARDKLEAPVQKVAEQAKPQPENAEPALETASVSAVIPETAKVETAVEAADLAEEADLVQTCVEPEDENHGEQPVEKETVMVEEEPVTVDDAVSVAQVETAEKIIDLAEESELVQAPTKAPEKAADLADEADLVLTTADASDMVQVETAEEAAEPAQEADLLQMPVKPDASEEEYKHAPMEEAPSLTAHVGGNDVEEIELEPSHIDVSELPGVEAAEEVVDIAKSELVETPIEPEGLETNPELAAVEEVAPLTDNVETTGEAVSLAQDAELIHAPDEPLEDDAKSETIHEPVDTPAVFAESQLEATAANVAEGETPDISKDGDESIHHEAPAEVAVDTEQSVDNDKEFDDWGYDVSAEVTTLHKEADNASDAPAAEANADSPEITIADDEEVDLVKHVESISLEPSKSEKDEPVVAPELDEQASGVTTAS